MRLILVIGVTLILMFVVTRTTEAKQTEMVVLTGCVQGFSRGQ